jgi:hypothetical protein
LTVVQRDFSNSFRIGSDVVTWGGIIEAAANNERYGGRGGWPEDGRAGSKTQFTVSSFIGLSMRICTQLLRGTQSYFDMVKNTEIIAVHQDSLAIQPKRIKRTDGSEIWWKPLKDGSRAVCFYNRTSAARTMSVTWSEILLNTGAATVRDLWQHQDLGSFTDAYTSASIGPDSVVAVKITGSPKPWEAAWNLYTIEPQYASCPWKKYWDASWGPYTGSCAAVEAAAGRKSGIPGIPGVDMRADGTVRITGPVTGAVSATILSPDGRVVLRRLSRGALTLDLASEGLSRGIHILTVSAGGMTRSRLLSDAQCR